MSSNLDAGGPAFPSTAALATAPGVVTPGHAGMTLRDYFAAAAMQDLLAYSSQPHYGPGIFARDAYILADAMLAARANKEDL